MTNVTSALIEDGSAVYYTDEFRAIIEEHLPILQVDPYSEEFDVDGHINYRYENNFYGLLTYLKHPMELYWIIMRINGLHSPREFKRNAGTILIPKDPLIEELVKLHSSKESFI